MQTAVVEMKVGSTWRLLLRELSAFGVVGLACFVLDVALFQVLYAGADVGAVTSKLIATLTSTTAAFLGHRFWSFAHREQTSLRQGYLRFAVINGGTLLLGLAVVATVRYGLGQESSLTLQLANIGSIALGTCIRWLAYRRWVFRAPAGPIHEVAPPRPDRAPAMISPPVGSRPGRR